MFAVAALPVALVLAVAATLPPSIVPPWAAAPSAAIRGAAESALERVQDAVLDDDRGRLAAAARTSTAFDPTPSAVPAGDDAAAGVATAGARTQSAEKAVEGRSASEGGEPPDDGAREILRAWSAKPSGARRWSDRR